MVSDDPLQAFRALIPCQSHGESLATGFGRDVLVEHAWERTCAFTYDWLCGFRVPVLGATDFSAICSRFDTIIVGDVPQMRLGVSGRAGDAARRFANFIDVAYDRRVRVLVTTLHPHIFDAGNEDDRSVADVATVAAFTRAASRWTEMSAPGFAGRSPFVSVT